jgi:serine/threonine-protein kinase HipA
VTSPLDVSTADVWKGERRAARLERSPSGVRFRYEPDYVGPPVATTLPVSDQTAVSPGSSLPAYFTGLLPEGRRLGALRRSIKTSADDELSLLLAVGADAVGDVRVVPAGEPPPAVEARVRLDDPGSLDFARLLRELDLRPDRSALAGVQDKTSAAMITVPAVGRGGQHLLKLDPPEFPGLSENEACLLAAARTAGLRVSDGQLLRDRHGAPGLAVVRFDRPTGLDQPARLAVEDGCQVLGRPPGDKYLVGYLASFAALAVVCDARLLAVRTLLEQLVFSILSANGDAHAKNFSVLQEPDGEWRVSPAYDLPTSQPYGRRSDVGAPDVQALAAELGLPPSATRRVLRQATERVELWLPSLDLLPYDLGRRRNLRRVVEQRRARLSPR